MASNTYDKERSLPEMLASFHRPTTMANNTIDKELSLPEMLASFLTDDALNDITLQGNDGAEVKANKFLLSARSTVFRGMLLGNFQESSSRVVKLSFPGTVLQAVVEYILTDSAKMLHRSKKRKHDDDSSSMFDFQEMYSLVLVAEAASFFLLPGLGKAAIFAINRKLAEWPSSSFALFQVCRMAGPSVPEKLIKIAEASIRETPIDDTTVKDCDCLSADVLEEILKDEKMGATEYQLFQLLERWAETNKNHENQDYRQKTAMGLAKYICLHKIDPKLLSTSVTSSGLFDPEELSEAGKYQASMVKTGHSQSDLFATPRAPAWTTQLSENSGPPDKIMVKDAGSEAVNGIYARDGFSMGLPRYSMEGENQGVPCTYHLFAAIIWGGEVFWFISILDKDHPGTGRDFNFYRAIRTHDHCPPSDRWEKGFSGGVFGGGGFGRGVEPPPKLRYPICGWNRKSS